MESSLDNEIMAGAATLQSQDRLSLDGSIKAVNSRGLRRIILQFILLDAPLLLVLTLYAGTLWIHHVHDLYLQPQMDAAYFDDDRKDNEFTYYARPCDASDISTTNAADLFLTKDATAEEAYQHQLEHGFSIFKSALSLETANNLRSYAVSKNQNLTAADSIYVIENEHRFSFGLDTEEPSVAAAVKELTSHRQLSEAVEQILGDDPALIEMTTITITAGAVEQWWHGDVYETASPVRYARTFAPSYSIFVQLQNTTKEMGATWACPGSHYCSGAGDTTALCEMEGFPVVDEHGFWAAGDALLMNMNSWHRGGAHVDPEGEDRVMFILTFAPKPRAAAESRQMSQGITFSLSWQLWGHVWSDLQKADTVMVKPWTYLRTLGLYKPRGASWGIDYVTGSLMRIANKDHGFDEQAMEKFVELGGIPYLPYILHGQVDYEQDSVWHHFLFDTLLNIERFLRGIAGFSICGYMVVSILLASEKASFCGCLGRLGGIVGFVYLLFALARFHVDNTRWAKEIQAGRRFTSVFENDADVIAPTSFSTFPTRHDVLIQNRCDSDYLHLYKDFVDGHPGNRRLLNLVDGTAPTYDTYPPKFREASVKYIVDTVVLEQGRFLDQNLMGQWTLTDDSKQAQDFVKKVLTSRSSAKMASLLKQIRHSISDYRFGVYRDSVLGSKHMIPFLRQLEEHLFNKDTSPNSSSGACGGRRPLARPQDTASLMGRLLDGVTTAMFRPVSNVFVPPSLTRRSVTTRMSIPSSTVRTTPQEPFPGAWLASGDRIEGLVHGHWYIGTIIDISPKGHYYVQFPDGDDGLFDRRSIRPVSPYVVGEKLGVLVVELEQNNSEMMMEYRPCEVVGQMDDGTYHVVALDETNEEFQNVPDVNFRRDSNGASALEVE